MENPQFFFKQPETQAKLSSHELVALAKFHNVWKIIVDFPFVANFADLPANFLMLGISEKITASAENSREVAKGGNVETGTKP